MKNKIWLVFLVLALAVSPVLVHGCAPAPQEKPTIRLVENDWTSQRIGIEIIEQIVTQQLGYTTERLLLSPSISWPAMEKGEADISTEIWLPSRLAEIQPFIDRGGVELGAENFPGGSAWVLPRFVVYGDPARGIEPIAPDLESVLDLKDEEEGGKGYWKLFENPEEPGLGELVGGSPGWVDDVFDRSLILGYELPMWRSNQSEAIMMARMIAADKKGDPLLMYIWNPHWIFAAVDLIELTFPNPYDADLYDPEEVKPVMSGYEKDCLTVPTVVRPGLKDDAPDVYRLIKNFSLGADDINIMMLRVDVEEEEIPVVAADWINQNQDVIDQWLGK